jgi:hypothetical protein
MCRIGGIAEQEDSDEQELRRRYYERLSDWSEPDAIKIHQEGGVHGLLMGWKSHSS